MTAPVTPVPIVAYSGSLPDPSDPTTYGTRGRAVWAWEVGDLYNGMNALGTATYTNALAAAESAEAATMTAGALMWNAATNYTTGQNAISPTDMQTYRRNSPGGVDATDPAASASWTLVGDRFLKKTGGTGLGSMSFSIDAFMGKETMTDLPPHDGFLTNWVTFFQNTSANSSTHLGVAPNGTGTASGYFATAGGGSLLWGGFSATPSGLDIHSSRRSASGDEGPINFKFRNVTKVAITRTGVIQPYGIQGRQGTSGGTLGNAINFYYTGSAIQAWVDTTNLGNVTITSDYRIKRDIRTMEQPALERIAALRPVLYQYADNEQFSHKAEDREREGFIAHELAEVIPSAVEGEKDAPNQIQSLRIDALVAVLVKAVQEQQAQIEELRDLVGK